MKKLLGFVFLCIPLYVWGDNVVFNPSFDMTPWDTGWVCDTSTSAWASGASAYAGASFTPDSGLSLPYCCYLHIGATVLAPGSPPRGSAGANARAEIMQNFNPITTGCMLKANVKDSCFWDFTYWGRGECYIQLHIDGEWETVWQTFLGLDGDRCIPWREVRIDVAGDTIDGIKFLADANVSVDELGGGAWAHFDFWIDDISISEVGVEEDSRLQIANYKVEISPNPFIQSTTIKYHLPAKSKVSLEIYDITGRTVKILVNEKKEAGNYDISFDARGLSAGIYFAKLVANGVKKTKKLTILK